jgi:hypothetical protein
MELATYREYLRRAEDAESVRELHQIAHEVQALYRNDPDAEAVDRACWMHAERLIARGRHGPASAPAGERGDWKERAARM